MSTLTTANSSFSLAAIGLYDSPQSIQGYAADDAFTQDAVDMAETVMGVDGKLSAGFVFNPVKQTVSIMPTSPSLDLFDTLVNTQRAQQEVFILQGVIMLPSIGRKYTLLNGVLTSGKPLPDAKKLLQPLQYQITWEQVVSEPM